MALNTISEAIEAIKKGEVIIVVDDEKRENEGDFVAAAEIVTPEVVNFMATHGRGLICTPLTEQRCKALDLQKMVDNNTDPMETAFTVTVDFKGEGVTTGISAFDRCKTIRALTNSEATSYDFSRPGHIFPLVAKEGGVLRRTGHTEAAIDLARLAGFQPAGVIVEIMNEDGTMARLPELYEIARKHHVKIVSIEDLIAYRMQHDSLIVKRADLPIQTRYGKFRLRAYEQTTNKRIHMALTYGDWKLDEPVLTRIHSSKITNDFLGMLTGSVGRGLDGVFKMILAEKKGAFLFVNPQQDSESLLARIASLKEMQSRGIVDAPPPLQMDHRDFGIGAQILHDLNIRKLKVISNSQQQPKVAISGYGITIDSYVSY